MLTYEEQLTALVGRKNAAKLAETFVSAAQLARAAEDELAACGLTPGYVSRIRAAIGLAKLTTATPPPRADVYTPAQAAAFFAPAFAGLDHEELHGLFLDRRHRVIAHRMITVGSDGFTVVDPRQVYQIAVRLGAFALLIAHNHPSGDPTPSQQDRDITRKVGTAGRLLGIRLLDHLVFGAGRFVSLAEEGALPAWEVDSTPWTD